MIFSRNTESKDIKPLLEKDLQRSRATRLCEIASWLFAGEAAHEMVTTRTHFEASPKAVWQNLMFFEEIPGEAPLLLRTFLPRPVRTAGDKRSMGSNVHCEYTTGELTKRITLVETARSLQFEVLGQKLGIEKCVETMGGSYRLRACVDGTEVKLTTNYKATLRPRFFWRRLEALLIGQLHRHIFSGLRDAIRKEHSARSVPVPASLPAQHGSGGGLACTVSPSPSRR